MHITLLLIITISTLFTHQAENAEPINVLYITGGKFHNYEAQQELLTSELDKRLNINWTINFEAGDRNDFKLTIHSDPDWHEDYDAVIYNMCSAKVTDEDYVENVVRTHYESGTAAIFLHCAMHSFRDAQTKEWDRLIGFETYHHEREQREFEIIATDSEHPVMNDFPQKNWISPKDELYIVIKEYDTLIPLAYAYGPETKKNHTVMWANTYGNARVIGTTAGHNNEVMADKVYIDFLVNGLVWATSGR
ncbi:MAG: ThuA domain-containing protein [Balneolales bacterium]